ncbi:hypothetical protein JOC54_000010 [Alkalihalobacillus xiaoxiensis]|uniref:Lipoprotein n=1 Tax=Shouchella xiaoxiensis TaxID=766895 RepID=A0ABS2SMN6_9BACI|nr:hypothetical protein [Shouchella xiaoxiensis]MBM7836779.1 hypothetical protein [Shouchella xiaoxiensis]
MKKWLSLSTLCVVLLIGGCNTGNDQQEPKEEVNGEDTQEDPSTEQTPEDEDAEQEGEDEGVQNNEDFLAIEDEFTKDFLVETEVEPGFHQMRGELDGFEMLIPENGIISDLLHDIENNAIETIIFTFNNYIEKKLYDVKLMYYKKYPEEVKQNYLNVFKTEVNFDGEYKYAEANGLEMYYGSFEDEDEYGPYMRYFGYLFAEERNQAISFTYMAMCQGEGECSISLEEESEMAEKLMYSIRLLDQ